MILVLHEDRNYNNYNFLMNWLKLKKNSSINKINEVLCGRKY